MSSCLRSKLRQTPHAAIKTFATLPWSQVDNSNILVIIKFSDLKTVRFTVQVLDLSPHTPHALCTGPPGPIPADHAMLRRAELAKAADGAVAALVALLKRPAVDTLNGPLRIVAVQARRPAYRENLQTKQHVSPCSSDGWRQRTPGYM